MGENNRKGFTIERERQGEKEREMEFFLFVGTNSH